MCSMLFLNPVVNLTLLVQIGHQGFVTSLAAAEANALNQIPSSTIVSGL